MAGFDRIKRARKNGQGIERKKSEKRVAGEGCESRRESRRDQFCAIGRRGEGFSI